MTSKTKDRKQKTVVGFPSSRLCYHLGRMDTIFQLTHHIQSGDEDLCPILDQIHNAILDEADSLHDLEVYHEQLLSELYGENVPEKLDKPFRADLQVSREELSQFMRRLDSLRAELQVTA